MVPGGEYATGLERVIKELGLKISELQKEQFLLYIELLMEGLEKQRLMGDRRGLTLVEKHLFDSLYPLKIWQKPEGSLLDLGTGAGMPGIPLKIYLPERTLYLMDSNRRKIAFLRRVGAELKLKNVYYLPGRAEEWGRDPGCREQFDCVVCRAVAKTMVLVELGLPLIKRGGYLLLYKGKQGEAEMEEASLSLRLCGGRLEQRRRYRLPTGEWRTLYMIKKIKATPQDYPRRPGLPARKPLTG
ncbi:MAG: 16S rRNA (guanine(527)-N(7))-methyltransferase RsmG [Firmicutes bacterium]|nr:16S rRNA (guanine(527)-N(7))-methyltransferase RsmG [Bacillota bacterium]